MAAVTRPESNSRTAAWYPPEDIEVSPRVCDELSMSHRETHRRLDPLETLDHRRDRVLGTRVRLL